MRREEESEEEVFERRRKIQKKEGEEREKTGEIENLFTDESAPPSEEESLEEPGAWKLGGAGTAGILFEIFGDGTDYAHVLEALSASPEARPAAPREEPGRAAPAPPDRERLLSSAAALFPRLPRESVRALLECVLAGTDRAEALGEALPHMVTLHEKTALLQLSQLAAQRQDAEKLRARVLQALGEEPLARFARQALHTLSTGEEYARVLRWAATAGARLPGTREGELRATQKIAGTSAEDVLRSADPAEPAGPSVAAPAAEASPHNPWLFQAALEAALETYTLAVHASTDAAPLALSVHFPAAPLLLTALEKRGVQWSVVLDRERTAQRAAERHGLGGEEKKAVCAFVLLALPELGRTVRREALRRAEAHVQGALFDRLLALAGMDTARQSVRGVWLSRGTLRHTLVDARGAKVSSGATQRKEELEEESGREVLALTGTGLKLRMLLRRKACVYVPEELLRLSGGSSDLSSALCAFARSPLPVLQRVLSLDKPLPSLVPLQSLLSSGAVRSVWEHALELARAQKELQESSEYTALRKNLQEYLKSGGDVLALPVSAGASPEDVRRAVKETAAPHTGWKEQSEEPTVSSPVLRMAYLSCLSRLKNTPLLPPPLSPREEFLAVSGVSEPELLSLETKWALSSGCELSLPGKTLEGTVCKTTPECLLQLENGVLAAFAKGLSPRASVGQRLPVQVQEVDLVQQRVAVCAVESHAPPASLRALSDRRVKQVTAAGAVRLLREKPQGAFVLRPSSTHRDSLVLTLRMTEYPDECVCAHLRVRERPDGYELEGRVRPDLSSVVSSYVPAYTKVLRRVTSHRRFAMSPLEEIKESVARGAVPCAFSVSRTANSCVSFVHPPAAPERAFPEETLLCVTEKGLLCNGKLYSTPESVCAAHNVRAD